MKRMLALMAILIVIVLSGCSAETKQTDNGAIGLPQNVLQADISATLKSDNQTVKLDSFEIIKSRTQDTDYELSVQAKAKNNVADFEYTVKLLYIKYDEGWMLEQAAVESVAYEVKRVPSQEKMAEYVSEYLRGFQYFELYGGEDILAMTNIAIGEYGHHSILAQDALEFSWDAVKTETYLVELYHFITIWEYVADKDNWELAMDPDQEYNHYIRDTLISSNLKNIDCRGEWEMEYSKGGICNVKIEDYSDQSMTVEIPNEIGNVFNNYTDIFLRQPDPDYDVYYRIYKNKDGDELKFLSNGKALFIEFIPYDKRVYGYITINEELPVLK